MSTFKSQIISHVNLIQCPKSMDRVAVSTEFPKNVADWLACPAKLHVLDFRDVTTINSAVYRPFAQFRQHLAAKESMLFSVNMSTVIFEQIKAEGMEGIFSPVNSVKEALEKSGLMGEQNKSSGGGAPTPSISVEFLGPFISAVLSTIITMSGTKVMAGKPKPIENKKELKIDIGSTMVMSNVTVQGRVGLYFSEEVFKNIYLKISKEKEFKLDSKMSLDLVRELLNIAFGKAKTDWNNLGYSFKRDAIPESFIGEKLKAHKQNIDEEIVLPFETADGTFYMGMSLTKVGSKSSLAFQT